MSLTLKAGDLTIHRVIEQETTFLPAQELFPELSGEVLAENRAALKAAKALDDSDTLILCFQSYIVKTPHHTILIDSCIGNDKPRPQRPKWNMKTDDTYARALAAAGISVGDIDYVMCTHLHVDHVGWNTRLDNGRWVPTFPKAKYLFSKREFEWLKGVAEAEPETESAATYNDSVGPIVAAGQAVLIDEGYEIEPGITLELAAGHTPGSMVMRVQSGQGRATLIGDICHHPLQVFYPEWNSAFCEDADGARANKIVASPADRAASLDWPPASSIHRRSYPAPAPLVAKEH